MDRALLRIIDANANRASEGARVLEDAARLALGSAALAARCKALRHGLRAALAPTDTSSLLAARDTPGDVGTRLTGATEHARANLADLCTAAAKRTAEALRVLEESLKVAGPHDHALAPAAGAIKALRYESYELEKLIVLALNRPRRQWRLCVLITAPLCTRPWDEVARRAIEGGADCLQLREKDLPDGTLLARATTLVQIASSMRTPEGAHPDVIINDRPDIAALCGASGVHLGQDDLPVAAARIILGPRALVGVSTASIEDARRALDDGADYIGLGPMFASSTKAKPRLAGPEYLREFLAWDRARVAEIGGAPTPHLAISGIDESRAGQLASEGCAGVAVSSVVCSAAKPEMVCRAILEAMAANQI